LQQRIILGSFLLGATALAVEPAWTPLREIAQGRIHMGTAVKYGELVRNAAYRDMIVREYDMVTPENALKWGGLRPADGKFDFGESDAIIDFAVKNKLLVRGHTLCWNGDKFQPSWLLNGNFTPAQARVQLETHIKTVIKHYQGKVFCWDVVNESVENSPKKPALNDGYWLRQLGPEYIELAFRWAREADPKALLFYNDYDLGQPMGPKSNRIFELVKSLKEKGVPIDGVGLQSHYNVTKPPTAEALREDIQRYAALGLKVHITELDVTQDVRVGSPDKPLEERLAIQARVYGDTMRAALSSPACTAVVTWGFSDRWGIESFERTARQNGTELPQRLPFDRNLKPKSAAIAMAEALSGKTLTSTK
jgi:endo-1,4-beta-xylanase